MLDNSQLERCRSVLGSDHATNFEARMVGEVYLYWIIYESCSASPVDLPKTQAALHLWKDEWKFLFGTQISYQRIPPVHYLIFQQINLDPNSFKWDFILHSFWSTINR